MAIAPVDVINVREIDISDIYDIYRIESSIYDYPWSLSIFRDCVEKEYDCFLASSGNNVIGYIISKITPLDSHILNLTIRSDYRRLGIASNFLDFIINKANLVKSKSILLEAKVSNNAAKSLYKKFGFKIIGLRKDYYRVADGREDAVIFKKNLN